MGIDTQNLNSPPTPIGESPLPSEPSPTNLTTFDAIRTETIFSRLPIHNLAKTGRVNISIEKKTPDGQVELKWEVSYSDRYGQARQLAYKLDTIVIDAALEEAGKPLPERIKLGSLRDICKELGLSEGENVNTIRRAFLQNAFAGIVAKFKYRANDGTEHTFEAGFTRYSVIFTGQKFTDGSKADAVYIELHPRYREVLNNAPWRPLSLDYKKQLAPGPQRFYEIVSFKIFNALRFKLETADLLYSEYCQASTQQRYFDYDHFKKQMYKIHKPHLDAGYIAKVEYEDATDEEGKTDWRMCYAPGPRAIAEYNTFNPNRKHRPLDTSAATIEAPAVGESRRRGRPPRQPKLDLQPEVNPEHLAALTSRGVTERKARQLLANLSPERPVLDLLEYADVEIARQSPRIQNPPGFYICYLEDHKTTPPSFISRRKAEEIRAANEVKAQEQLVRQAEVEAAAESEKTELDRAIAALNPADRLNLQIHAEALLASENDYWYAQSKATGRKDTLNQVVTHRMRKLLKDRSGPLPAVPVVETKTASGAAVPATPEATQPAASQPAPERRILNFTHTLQTILQTPQLTAIATFRTTTQTVTFVKSTASGTGENNAD